MNTIANIATAILDNAAVTHDDIKRLAAATRSHTRASGSFLSELSEMNETQLKSSVSSLAASWRRDVAKSGISYDALSKSAEALHSKVKVRRDNLRKQLFTANQTRNRANFDVARKLSDEIVTLDKLLSDMSNLHNNAIRINEVLAEAA